MQDFFPFVVEHKGKDLIQQQMVQGVWGGLRLWKAENRVIRGVEHKVGQMGKVQEVACRDFGVTQPECAVGKGNGVLPG